MRKIVTICILIVISFVNSSYAQQDYNIRKKHFNVDKSGLAIEGYDPLSYFENNPVKGRTDLYVFHRGIKYLFISQKHVDEFKKMPEKYEPAYGGWCAYAMGANAEKVEVDVETYKIINGQLYLYYHTIINNTLNKWNADENNLKPKADNNWTNTIKK